MHLETITIHIYLLSMIKVRVRWCILVVSGECCFCSVPPPIYFFFENSRNELTRPVMGTIFLVGERAKRARHSQVCSIENCDIIESERSEHIVVVSSRFYYIYIYSGTSLIRTSLNRNLANPNGKVLVKKNCFFFFFFLIFLLLLLLLRF